jgi:hypothetical protein
MEVELHDRHSLHILGFDVVNPADVQEVVLVIVRQQAFHLRRVHPAVGLADVDDRQVQVREDVDRHPERRQDAPQRHGDDGDHHRERAAHREGDRIHEGARSAR